MEWSGDEETFGVEGSLSIKLAKQTGNGLVQVGGEFFLNQPFDGNIYEGTDERRSYLANFKRDYFEISQFYLSWKKDFWELRAGKIQSPFGRCYQPLLSNAKFDAPFIRTEAILWRETGFHYHARSHIFEFDAAFVNGCEDLDTNSSKAVVFRGGIAMEMFRLGISAKFHDGIGSEEQKEYKNHAGFDVMVRFGRWTLSAEGIYDEYGFYHEFNQDSIFWQHDIYYRQLNYKTHVPIAGYGYYVDLNYQSDDWMIDLCYGQYFPQELNHLEYPQHDIVNHRGIVKASRSLASFCDIYGALIVENGDYTAQEGRARIGLCYAVGMTARF
ncbi:MAG TPA: hypothetical protein DEB39_05090 [Planctomycetaceae bacterium]|nr:hypothetical protein [Planctomycetaceae bacterium]